MSNPRKDNMPWLSPYLTVRDTKESIEFYSKAFGFTLHEEIKDDKGNTVHVEMNYQGKVVIMFAPESAFADFGTPSKAPVNTGGIFPMHLYVYFQDADIQFQKAIDAGGEVIMELTDSFWGDRYGQIRDPNGYLWGLATYKGDK